MNLIKQNYLTAFLFFIYMAFVGHFFTSETKEAFLKNYSLASVYFFMILALLLAMPKWLSYIKSQNLLLKEIKDAFQFKAKTLMPILIFSHLLAVFNPLANISSFLSELLKFNQQIIVLLLGFGIFLLSLWLWKFSNKKLLIPILLVFFIHGFYHIIMWNSEVNQMKVKESIYHVAVENNFKLKECEKEISCSIVPQKNILSGLEKIEDKKLQSHIHQYLTHLDKKIQNSSDDVVTLSFPEGITAFRSRYYQPIGVYNKKTGYFILDYQSMFAITEIHEQIYYKITGIAGFFWIFMSLITVFWHYYVREKWMKK